MFVSCATTIGSSFWSIIDITVVSSKVSACSFSPVLCYMILPLKSSGSEFSCYFHWLWKLNLPFCTIFAFVILYSSLEKSFFLQCALLSYGNHCVTMCREHPLYSSVWSKPKLKEAVVSIRN